jgi:hypothetical protein
MPDTLHQLRQKPEVKPEPKAEVRLPRLLSSEEHWGGTFYSRLVEYLTERPVRLPEGRGRPAEFPGQPESGNERGAADDAGRGVVAIFDPPGARLDVVPAKPSRFDFSAEAASA